MRAFELFENDYNDTLRSEIITLLTAVSAEGFQEVHTQNLLRDLEQQGFAVDEESILELLSTIDVVSKATADKITIATSEVNSMVGTDASEVKADKVDNMATAKSTKDIGNKL
jgi:hypothetical protein